MGKVFSGAAKAVTGAVKAVVQPVYNATLKQIPGVDNALVGLDKSVGKAIPGGWGTVASIAASFIPGAQLAAMGMTKAGLMTGLGALSGSGVMRKGNQFNLQGAIMGGAMAYGASQLSAGLQEAGQTTTKAVEEAAKASAPTVENIAANLGVEGASTSSGSQAAMLADQIKDFGPAGLESIKTAAEQVPGSNLASGVASNFAYTPSGEMVPSNYGGDVTGGVSVPSTPQPTGLSALASGTGSNISDAGTGIKNLAGFGAEEGTAAAARSAFTAPITKEGVLSGIMGTSGMSDLEAQRDYLEQQLSAGNIAQSEYDAELAKINAQIATANQAVSANPFSSTPDRSFEKQDTLYAGVPATDTLYSPSADVSASKTLYAVGGSVDDESGMDEARGLFQGNMSNGLFGGGIASFATGGAARFLSGGGDGMSDSIKASINGTQEARLADGEFVIPADVVSHLGNGSSKAGAKQLYSMMDRVRQARVGTKKQGKKINPRKYMTA